MGDMRRSRSASYSRQSAENDRDDDIGFSSPLVKLVVSKDKVFYVHEKLVRAKSRFLDAAFSDAYTYPQHQRSVIIPDDDPDCLNVDCLGPYLHWLYSGTFRSQLIAAQNRDLFLTKLYIFGEVHQERGFQNAVINEFVHEYRRSIQNAPRTCPVGAGVMFFMFNKLPKHSPIRDLMVDMAVVYGHVEYFTNAKPDYPNGYLEEVVKAFLRCGHDQNFLQGCQTEVGECGSGVVSP